MMDTFSNIITALREYGWPGMSEQDAWRIITGQQIDTSTLIRPISEYLAIAMREARSGTQQLRIAA